jgi:hypothetical protein
VQTEKIGGLGFADTIIRNIFLLSKWIYKLGSGAQDLRFSVLRNKYMEEVGFCQSSEVGGSQFWTNLRNIKKRFKRGSSYCLGNGRKTFFWLDVWIGSCPLKYMFPSLYV